MDLWHPKPVHPINYGCVCDAIFGLNFSTLDWKFRHQGDLLRSFPLVTTLQIQQHDPELDADKRSITNHPLYPLLAKLLQQCELASVRPDSPPSPGAFDDELRAYVQHRLEPENTDLTRPNKGKDLKEYYSNHYDTAYSSSRVVRNPTAGRFKQGDSKKASRPQSTDCRIYSTDKSRDFDKSIDMVDPDYSAESGTRDPAQFDDSKKLQVFVEDSEVDELVSLSYIFVD
ncbi:unnamed protein product [Dicrocoelium dendriticum]|nr:unnamed protein product [Dicrocoelium dendriticum]